jgi:hypothetical protein
MRLPDRRVSQYGGHEALAYDHQKHVRPSGADGLADLYLLGTLLHAVCHYGVDSYPEKDNRKESTQLVR